LNSRKRLLNEITTDILKSENILDWDYITEKVERIDTFMSNNDSEYIELRRDNPLFNYVRLIEVQGEEYEKAELEINNFIMVIISLIRFRISPIRRIPTIHLRP